MCARVCQSCDQVTSELRQKVSIIDNITLQQSAVGVIMYNTGTLVSTLYTSRHSFHIYIMADKTSGRICTHKKKNPQKKQLQTNQYIACVKNYSKGNRRQANDEVESSISKETQNLPYPSICRVGVTKYE